jgi:hypothetical protein
VPALTFRASANFALANFLASRSFGNVSVALGCRRFASGRSNETYQVPRDLLAMRPSRGLGRPQRTILYFLVALSSGLRALLLVTTESSQHPDPRKHRRPARRRDQDQGLHRRLPFKALHTLSARRLALGLGKLRDVGPGILERHARRRRAAESDRRNAAAIPFPASVPTYCLPIRSNASAAVCGRVAERRTEVNLTDQGYCAHRLAGSRKPALVSIGALRI